jgi:hypothetical protein
MDLFMMFAFDIKQNIMIYTNHPKTFEQISQFISGEENIHEKQWNNISAYFSSNFKRHFYPERLG